MTGPYRAATEGSGEKFFRAVTREGAARSRSLTADSWQLKARDKAEPNRRRRVTAFGEYHPVPPSYLRSTLLRKPVQVIMKTKLIGGPHPPGHPVEEEKTA
jgi:hypothetical protein